MAQGGIHCISVYCVIACFISPSHHIPEFVSYGRSGYLHMASFSLSDPRQSSLSCIRYRFQWLCIRALHPSLAAPCCTRTQVVDPIRFCFTQVSLRDIPIRALILRSSTVQTAQSESALHFGDSHLNFLSFILTFCNLYYISFTIHSCGFFCLTNA